MTARKGVGRFTLRVTGIGSHAGGAFAEGASAIVELAEQIRALHAMVDVSGGITVNVAPIWGGSRPNVIAPDAGCEIDLRVPTVADGERMEQAIFGLRPVDARCSLSITGGMNRPPFAETPGILSLYERARALGVRHRHRTAEAASRRRLGRQFHRRPRRSHAGRPRLSWRRRACQP